MWEQRGVGVMGEASTDIPLGLHKIRLATLTQYYSGTCHYNIQKLNINSYDSSFLLIASYCFQT